MNIALYPGSFNPFHRGHLEVVKKALQVFDRVIVARGINPKKANEKIIWDIKLPKGANYIEFTGLTADLARNLGASAIIKGIRNATDLEDERTQQTWNEKEFGLTIPTFYIIASPELMHVSSTDLRAISKLKKRAV